MVRFTIFSLLFMIVFLSGMVSGLNKQIEYVDIDEKEEIEEVIEEPLSLYAHEDDDRHLMIQKFASLLETIVKKGYELIVSFMFYIAKIFTG